MHHRYISKEVQIVHYKSTSTYHTFLLQQMFFENCKIMMELSNASSKTRLLLVLMFFGCSCGQVTRRENILLSRKKRYLAFPEGSNFVITMSYVKSVMVDTPRFVFALGECDFPFKLPSDPRWFRKHRRYHYLHKRDIYSKLEFALNENGLNGNACVKRMICEVQQYVPLKGKSLAGDLLSALFTFTEVDKYEDHNFKDFCSNATFADCDVPLLKFVLGTIFGE